MAEKVNQEELGPGTATYECSSPGDRTHSHVKFHDETSRWPTLARGKGTLCPSEDSQSDDSQGFKSSNSQPGMTEHRQLGKQNLSEMTSARHNLAKKSCYCTG